MVLCVKLCSWVARPPRASSIMRHDVVDAELVAAGDSPRPGAHDPVVRRAPCAPSLSCENTSGPTSSTITTPARGEQLGTQVGVATRR